MVLLCPGREAPSRTLCSLCCAAASTAVSRKRSWPAAGPRSELLVTGVAVREAGGRGDLGSSGYG